MQQFLYEDHYRGKFRKLLILRSPDETNYRVYCDSIFLGIVKLVTQANVSSWRTEYDVLKPIATKIGQSIFAQQLSEE